MDIERIFKMSALQRTRTGRQVCNCIEEENECDQELSRVLIFSCFRRECSCLCGGNEMNLPIISHLGPVGLPTATGPVRARLRCIAWTYYVIR